MSEVRRRPTRRQLEVLRPTSEPARSRPGPMAGHRRDDRPSASLGAVPADGLSERSAGGVLVGRWPSGSDARPSGVCIHPSRSPARSPWPRPGTSATTSAPATLAEILAGTPWSLGDELAPLVLGAGRPYGGPTAVSVRPVRVEMLVQMRDEQVAFGMVSTADHRGDHGARLTAPLFPLLVTIRLNPAFRCHHERVRD